MLFSIIIPVYNVGMFLEKCLQSWLNQTYQNFELLVINDGSKDDSGAICDAFAELSQKIRLWHIENSGVSNARNVGISNARGDIVGFCDADDYVNTDLLENIMKCFESSNADIVATGYRKVYNDKTVEYKLKKTKSFLSDKFLHLVLNNSSVGGYAGNKWYRINLVENKKFNTVLTMCEDMHFAFNVISEKKLNIVVLPICPYNYVLHGSNTVLNPSNRFTEWGVLADVYAKESILNDIKLTQRLKLGVKNSIFNASINGLYHLAEFDNITEEQINIIKCDARTCFVSYIKYFNKAWVINFKSLVKIVVLLFRKNCCK